MTSGNDATRGVDVAGHGGVDDEQWPSWSGGACPPEVVWPEQDLGGRRRREQHVGVGELRAELAEGDAPSPGGARRGIRLLAAAARDDEFGGLRRRHERGDDPLAHLAGADDDDPPAGERPADRLGRERHRDVGERGDAARDPGLGPGALADLDGMTEQPVEHRTRSPFTAGLLVRRARTWRRISPSPSTGESMPDATSNRCRTASSSYSTASTSASAPGPAPSVT